MTPHLTVNPQQRRWRRAINQALRRVNANEEILSLIITQNVQADEFTRGFTALRAQCTLMLTTARQPAHLALVAEPRQRLLVKV